MSNAPTPENDPHRDDEMEPYYDFTNGEVGKYHQRFEAGTNLVKLDEDIARDFPTSQAVNDALRKYRALIGHRHTG